MAAAGYQRALRFARAQRRTTYRSHTPEEAARCTHAHYVGFKWVRCERDGPYVVQVAGRVLRAWAVRFRQRKDICEGYCLTHARREMRRRNGQNAERKARDA